MRRHKKARPQCAARDNARRCRRGGYLRHLGKGPYCRRHYERALRKNGETRTQRELMSIEAKAKRRALLVELGKGIRR